MSESARLTVPHIAKAQKQVAGRTLKRQQAMCATSFGPIKAVQKGRPSQKEPDAR